MPEAQSDAARQIAAERITDIGALRKNASFNRYFLARLNQKRAAIEKAYRSEAPANECLRQQLALLDEILGNEALGVTGMMDADERGSRSVENQ